MKHEIIVLQSAEADWLELFRQHGERFDDAFLRTTRHISAQPQIGVAYKIKPFRRKLIIGYPIGLFYSITPRRILVSALLDLRQDPAAVERKLKSLQP